MIKTKELMLGNWVFSGKHTEYPMQVVGIYEDEVYLDFEGNEADMWEVSGKDIMPIPITDKFLADNGFTEEKNGLNQGAVDYFINTKEYKISITRYAHKDYYFISIELLYDNTYLSFNSMRYVHELQNMLVMAGIDKKIKYS